MTVTDVRKDPTALTMTVASEWDAPIARVWQLWADPRKLERWWGPPTYPATVVEHDLQPGGKVSYFMTGPEGDEHHGWWKVVAVDEPNRLELVDGFADADGNPNDAMPTSQFTVSFTELPSGATRMVIETRFPSRAAMEQMTEMGMEEGMSAALGQIDAILAEDVTTH
jgi:uncharacterized protein YndB with AHSA1/START domain